MSYNLKMGLWGMKAGVWGGFFFKPLCDRYSPQRAARVTHLTPWGVLEVEEG